MIKLKKRVLFVGIPDMALICLDGLLKNDINIVGVVGPKKNHGTYQMFRQFCQSLNQNYIEYDRLDDPNFIKTLKNLEADIAVVCSFNYKIPKVMLDTVKDGFINVHPSLLPQYRGANPYSAVILNGEKESGLTLHLMDELFDTGDIVAQEKLEIQPEDTMGTLFNKFNVIALRMLIETLKNYENNPFPRKKQISEENLNNAPMFQEKDLLIDFNNSAIQIERQIRALNPFILARTYFRGIETKFLTAEVSTENSDAPIGSIIKIQNDKIYISTKDGVIVPTSMQFGSYFAGTTTEFIKIAQPQIGERFS